MSTDPSSTHFTMAKGVTLNQTSIAPDSAASLPMNDLDDWHLYLEMGEASSSRPGTGYFMSSCVFSFTV